MSIFSKKGSAGGLGRGVALSQEDEDLPRDLSRGDEFAPANDVPVAEAPDRAFVAEDRPMSKKEVAARARALKAEERQQAKLDKAAAKGSRGKGKKSAASEAEESARLSTRVLMEFYPGLTQTDAIETAKNWALNHFENPTGCFYFVQEVPGGWGIEVQEGVGKAYLPSVIDLCMEHPGQIVVVPMVRRKMTVAFSPGSGEFEAQVLREGADPVVIENSMMARRGPAMTPVMKQHINWLIAGGATFGLGALALLLSILLYGLDPAAKVPPEWRVTDSAQLPVMQWGKLQDDGTGSYVVRLEFQGGNWVVVRQASTADVLVVPGAPSDPSAIVPGDPAAVPAPGGAAPISPPGTPGAQPVPGPAPAPAPAAGAAPQITLPNPQ